MSLTKRQIIDGAFEEIGLFPGFYDLTPEQYQSAMRTLDLMVADWQNNAIRIGYNMASPPGSGDLDDDSGVPDVSLNACILGLAIQIAPRFGKAVSIQTERNFKNAYDNLVQNATNIIPEMQFPQSLPLGAGNKYWRYNGRYPFILPPVDPVADEAAGEINTSPSEALNPNNQVI